METSKPLLKLKGKGELSAILGELNNLLKNPGKNEPKSSLYYRVKGNLSFILKHQRRFKLKKIEDLSVPDLERLAEIISDFKIEDNSLKEKLDRLLDKKFRKICGSCLLIKLRYKNPYLFSDCNVEILFHYISAKEKFNRLEELKRDKKLAFILRKTYDSEKSNWFKEKYLRPTQNKWVHLVSAIDKLEILNPEEKEAILKHNAELKINKNLPVLAQLWNRNWLFRKLGIRNVEELRSIFSGQREFLEVKKNICGFFPKTLNFEKEDIFAEGSNLMRHKYVEIRKFCGCK